MRTATLALVAPLLAEAAVLQTRGGCATHLSISGAVNGPVGQRDNGQAIAGSGVTAATFYLDGGKFTDSQGRGCWLTPPTTVLQCDNSQAPTPGFTIGCDGTVSLNGQTDFYECQADNGLVNIYTQANGVNCGKIKITADSCHSGCPPPPPPPPTCPVDLSGSYQFPHLIIPIDSSQPNKAPGTSYNGQVTSTISSIFNFDIPGSYAGKKCQLVFLFPTQSQLQTSSYTFSGSGTIIFSSLNGVANQQTSYANAPSIAKDLATVTVAPGNSYSIATFDCPAGQAVSYELHLPSGGNTNLWYFQDYNPSPIGLYITTC